MGTGEGCPAREELSDVLSGRNAPAADRVLGHLETCARCSALAEEISREDELAQVIRARPPVTPDDSAEINALIGRVRQVVAEKSGRVEVEALNSWDNHSFRVSASRSTASAGAGGANEVARWENWVRATFPPADGSNAVRIANYLIRRVLGAGGMGVVFEAEDTVLRRPVAIKLLRPERATDDAARQRFLREARAAAGIQHDNVVALHSVGEERGIPYLVMPLLQGRSLAGWLRERPRPSYAEVLQIGEEIASGLAEAHRHGLIHRDVKPANVFLEGADPGSSTPPGMLTRVPDGATIDDARSHDSVLDLNGAGDDPSLSAETTSLKLDDSEITIREPELSSSRAPAGASGRPIRFRAKLLDFGLARGEPANRSDDDPLSDQGVVVGTPAYMAPEQASGDDIDQRADLFSLGCVLYRMLTGELPFPGRTTTQQLATLMTRDPVTVASLAPETPPELAALVMQLLQRDRSKRPQSADEVRERLSVIRSKLGQSSVQPATISGAKSARWIAAICLLVLACAGVVIIITHRDGTQTRVEANNVSGVNVKTNDPGVPVTVEATPEKVEAPEGLSPTWFEAALKLPAPERAEVVKAELQRRNPGLGDDINFVITGDRVRKFTVDSPVLKDITPLAALRGLQSIRLLNTTQGTPRELTDLRPLKGLKLTEALIEHCPLLKDFSPLDGMLLTHFSVYASTIPQRDWFARQNSIESLNVGGRAEPIDLSVFNDLPLSTLMINDTTVSDLTPLKHHQLEFLQIAATNVTDLEPLRGMPLMRLDMRQSPIENLEPLKGLARLVHLYFDKASPEQLALVKSLPSLRFFNQYPLDAVPSVPPKPAPMPEKPVDPLVPPQPIEKWLEGVSNLKGQALADAVKLELQRRNPELGERLRFQTTGETVHLLNIHAAQINDLAPLAALKDLTALYIGHPDASAQRRLSDLRPLAGLTKLKAVSLEFCPELRDFSPLHDKPLDMLSLYGTPLPDLAWLQRTNMRHLNLGGRTGTIDLAALRGLKLVTLDVNESAVRDLSPLKDMPLYLLSVANTNVEDITPLLQMEIESLNIRDTLVDDLTPLKQMPKLLHLSCNVQNDSEVQLLRSFPHLMDVNRQPLPEITLLPRAPIHLSITRIAETGENAEAWKLAKSVHIQLQTLNPGYDAQLHAVVRDKKVLSWDINSTVLDDISPLADLPDLETVRLWSSRQVDRKLKDLSPLRGKKLKHLTLHHLKDLTDFSPLEGMPLETLILYRSSLPDLKWLSTLKLTELTAGGRSTAFDLSVLKDMPLKTLNISDAPFNDLSPLSGLKLELLRCSASQIRDLSPLRGMPLFDLQCSACDIDDLSPLKDLPRLRRISCPVRNQADKDLLLAIPTLQEINNKPRAEFARE